MLSFAPISGASIADAGDALVLPESPLLAAAQLIEYLSPLVSEVAGVTLFEGPIPELPDDCVVLTIYDGEPGEYVMGGSLEGLDMETVYVNVHVRNALMTTAKRRAKAYYDLLENYNGSIAGITYHRVYSIDGPPKSLGQDQNARWNFYFNL